VAFGVAGSLFPQLLASIWDSCRQKARRIAAGDRFALQNVEKTVTFGALSEDEAGKMRTRL